MSKNILLCGVGGQGTVLASKLIAAAAMNKNIPVMSAETIGMAQKGGSVVSYIKFGDDIYCPMFSRGEADVIIAFEPAEAVRMLPFLKEDGVMIANTRPIIPVTSALGKAPYNSGDMVKCLKENVRQLTLVDCSEAAKELGSSRVINLVLLGAAIKSGALSLTAEDIKEALRQKVKPEFYELNCCALNFLS